MSRNAKDLDGICSDCKEWTTVHEPCCGAPVYVEGGYIDPGNYCEKCGEELDTERARLHRLLHNSEDVDMTPQKHAAAVEVEELRKAAEATANLWCALANSPAHSVDQDEAAIQYARAASRFQGLCRPDYIVALLDRLAAAEARAKLQETLAADQNDQCQMLGTMLSKAEAERDEALERWQGCIDKLNASEKRVGELREASMDLARILRAELRMNGRGEYRLRQLSDTGAIIDRFHAALEALADPQHGGGEE